MLRSWSHFAHTLVIFESISFCILSCILEAETGTTETHQLDVGGGNHKSIPSLLVCMYRMQHTYRLPRHSTYDTRSCVANGKSFVGAPTFGRAPAVARMWYRT